MRKIFRLSTWEQNPKSRTSWTPTKNIVKLMSFFLQKIPSLKFNIGPENWWWLGDDPFLLGPGLFSGALAVGFREGRIWKRIFVHQEFFLRFCVCVCLDFLPNTFIQLSQLDIYIYIHIYILIYTYWVVPLPRMPVTTRTTIFSVEDPELTLHLPLLLGGGTTQDICIYKYIYIYFFCLVYLVCLLLYTVSIL